MYEIMRKKAKISLEKAKKAGLNTKQVWIFIARNNLL